MLKNHLKNPCRPSSQNHQKLSRARQGIYNWPTAVNWLIRVYATDTNIERALSEFRSIKQKPNEEEESYYQRLMAAHARCGFPGCCFYQWIRRAYLILASP